MSMKLQVIKKQDDPICLRISIGGNNENAYITYRGDLAKVKILLDQVNETFKKLSSQDEPKVSDDGGKKYA